MHLHVFPQRAGVRVRLVTASHFAVVGLVAGVHVGVLLSVAAVGEASVASVEFTPEGFLTCGRERHRGTPLRRLENRMAKGYTGRTVCLWQFLEETVAGSVDVKVIYILKPLWKKPAVLLHY